MMKPKIVVLSFLPVLAFFALFVFEGSPKNQNFPERVKIALRDAGNRLLLADNDSTSLILPVIALDKSTFELSFENSLAILPDSLVGIIDDALKASSIPSTYIVEVMETKSGETAYSFESKKNKWENIVPCIGRHLPTNEYKIKIIFTHAQSTLELKRNTLLSLVALGFLGLGLAYWKKGKSSVYIKEDTQFSKIGDYRFYKDQNKLIKGNTTIVFTAKECELFSIFAEGPNQIIKRDLLIKKVWEDHGIVVGRSLDTFISRIRKKFAGDDSINIVTVHGVGYKLETP